MTSAPAAQKAPVSVITATSSEDEILAYFGLKSSGQLEPLTSRVNAFAEQLPQMLAPESEGAVFSPLDLTRGVGMLALGASGKTRKALDQATGAAELPKRLQSRLYGALDVLSAQGIDESVFSQAALLWVQDNYRTSRLFGNAVYRAYAPEIALIDFADGDLDAAETQFSEWLQAQTGSHFEDLDVMGLGEKSRLAGCTACFLSASWNTVPPLTAQDIELIPDSTDPLIGDGLAGEGTFPSVTTAEYDAFEIGLEEDLALLVVLGTPNSATFSAKLVSFDQIISSLVPVEREITLPVITPNSATFNSKSVPFTEIISSLVPVEREITFPLISSDWKGSVASVIPWPGRHAEKPYAQKATRFKRVNGRGHLYLSYFGHSSSLDITAAGVSASAASWHQLRAKQREPRTVWRGSGSVFGAIVSNSLFDVYAPEAYSSVENTPLYYASQPQPRTISRQCAYAVYRKSTGSILFSGFQKYSKEIESSNSPSGEFLNGHQFDDRVMILDLPDGVSQP